MSQFHGKTILITGAAVGLGRLLGELALKEGANQLIIWDVNSQQLNATVNEFRQQGFKVHGFTIDVTNTHLIIETAAKIQSEIGPVDILINNAGIVVGKNFIEHSHAEIDCTTQVNTQALMHITKVFLPSMVDRNQGHIVNIASAAGMVANPKMSVYCASKWAVIGWSDSLRIELEQSNSQIKVTTVTPYYIDTGMFAGVHSWLIPILKPEKAARTIIKGIKRNRLYVRMPLIIHLLPLTKGLLPTRAFDYIVGKLMGIYKSMEHFKGHGKQINGN